LPDGRDRPFVETGTETLDESHVPDGTVVPNDDLEDHVAFHAAPAGVVGVVRFDLAQQLRRRDARARTVRTAAGSSAAARADSGTFTLADAGPLAGSDAAVRAGPALSAFDGVSFITPAWSFVSAGTVAMGAATGCAAGGGGGGAGRSTGRWATTTGRGGGRRGGIGLDTRLGFGAFRCARGGGASCSLPPPPPPPPGPGCTR